MFSLILLSTSDFLASPFSIAIFPSRSARPSAHLNTMQKALSRASEAVTTAMESSKKVSDMKSDIVEPTSSDFLTSDFGVKSTSHDIWLSASTGDRKGPQLLEDNFGREKVMLPMYIHTSKSANYQSDYEIRKETYIFVSPSQLFD